MSSTDKLFASGILSAKVESGRFAGWPSAVARLVEVHRMPAHEAKAQYLAYLDRQIRQIEDFKDQVQRLPDTAPPFTRKHDEVEVQVELHAEPETVPEPPRPPLI